jgi:imidazolonepropionase-like amidohydrolase
MKNRFAAALPFMVLAACATALVIRNGTVVDGTGAPPISNGIVAIERDRIIAVGAAAEFVVPPTATLIDAQGGTVLPGLINSHTHSTGDPAIRREFLVDGVTTVCNVGTSLDRLSRFEQASTPEGASARVFWSGPIITAPGGYPGPVYGSQFSYEVATPEEARSAVADLLRRGAGIIKITLAPGDPRDPWPVLDLDEVKAIVEEAHAHSVPVRAHVFETYIAEDIVLPAGVDAIEHLPLPDLSDEEAESALQSPDPVAYLFDVIAPDYDDLLARLVEHRVAMVPTLEQLVGQLYEKPDRSPLEQFVLDAHLDAVRRYHALGGVVALGNDYGANPATQPGMPMTEMKLLLAAGLTPMQVLEVGTRHSATVCGQGSDLGTLEPGKLADVIIVDGDPLADIQALDEILVVIKGGEIAHLADRTR